MEIRAELLDAELADDAKIDAHLAASDAGELDLTPLTGLGRGYRPARLSG